MNEYAVFLLPHRISGNNGKAANLSDRRNLPHRAATCRPPLTLTPQAAGTFVICFTNTR
jgi:hypothetical protein